MNRHRLFFLFSFLLLTMLSAPRAQAQSIPPGCYYDQQLEEVICPPPKPFECAAQTTATPTIRAEGASELVAPLQITCTGGTPTNAGSTIPTATITISLGPSVSLTSRLLDPGGSSEVLLLLDDPSLSAQYPCETSNGICTAYGNGTGIGYYGGGTQNPSVPNNRNVFQGVISGPNTVIFRGIPMDPPGQTNSRTFTFMNIRVNASQLQVPTGGGTAVTASVALSGQQQVALSDTVQSVAIARASLRSAVRDANNTADVPNGVTGATSNAGTLVRVGTLRFGETNSVVFRPRTIAAAPDMNTSPAPTPQNQVGITYRSESGFFNPAFPTYTGRGNLGIAGLADSGSRLRAVFTQVPSGVTLYVGLNNDNSATEWARLISTNADGSGPFKTIPADSGQLALVPVTSGTGTAIWEVLRTDGTITGNLDFGVYVSHPAGLRAPFINVEMGFAAVSSVPTSSATAPLPRFVASGSPMPLIQFDPGNSGTLPTLRATPTPLSFTLQQGANSTAQTTLLEAILGTVAQNITFTATPGTVFPMQVNPTSGRTPATISVTTSTGNLAPGKYTANITITSTGAANNPFLIPVELTVTGRLQITSIAPNPVTAGRGAFDLTVTGAGFVSGSQVDIGGQLFIPGSGATATQLVVRVPAALVATPGQVPVTVVNPDQTQSNTVQLTVNPAPVLTQLNPSAVPPGAAANVAVIGRNLTRDMVIQVQGATVPSTFVDATRINASIPASALPASVASVNVSGLTGDGFSTNSLPLSLTSPLTLVAPPVQAGDRAITASIKGNGIVAGTRVEATPPGGSAATITPDAVAATAVDFTIPANLLTQAGNITFRLLPPTGSPSAPLTHPIQPAPSLTSLSPSTRPAGGAAFALTVSGANFLPGSFVRWNGASLTTTSGSGTSLTADVPANLIATRIAVNVTVEGPGGAASNGLPFDIALPSLPAISYGGLNVATSGTRADATLTLGSPYPADLRVQFTLTFAPDGSLPNDRAIVFTNGQRQIDANVPAGSTGPAQVSFQTGSTAGVVTLTPRFFAGSTDVTPSGVQSRTINIGRASPIIAATDVRCVRTNATLLTITTSGITNTREVTRATFDFTAASGETLASASFPIDTTAMFSGWFSSTNGQVAGGTFLYTQTFNVQPSSSGVASVGVTLTNASGASTPRTAQCTQ
ncbi:MAG: IPT/TIG domain-containing protein [Acidobacteriota bacterium]